MADSNLGWQWIEIGHGQGGMMYDDFYNFILQIIIYLGPSLLQH
jgi:hypothetical protein